MKLFLSADIEGCAGVSLVKETHREDAAYPAFAEEMTEEVIALSGAFHEAGVDEIVVKDGHGGADNIDPLRMPEYVTLIRGKSGHPFNMMFGLDESFDAVAYLGYHAPGGDPGFAISHTSTGQTSYILLNGERMSEFLLNSYTASLFRLPLIFLSGDRSICDIARAKLPGIETVETKRGIGDASFCVPKERVIRELREKAKRAIRNWRDTEKREGLILKPAERYRYEAHFKDWKRAYRMSFYPGMKQLDEFTVCLESENWTEIVTAHCFVVY